MSRPAISTWSSIARSRWPRRPRPTRTSRAGRPSVGACSSPDAPPPPAIPLTGTTARCAAWRAPGPDPGGPAGAPPPAALDLGGATLPAGTRLAIGSAVIEVTEQPHTGCAKFSARFGADALRYVNSPLGKELHLRGINAKVVQPGTIRAGDRITKVTDR